MCATSAHDVFISHQSSNKPWVEVLARNFEAYGYTAFYDKWGLIPGNDLDRELWDALHSSRAGVLVATPEAAASGWVQDEYSTFRRRQEEDADFRWVAVYFGELPDFPFLKNRLAVDFADSSPDGYRNAFYRLLCGIQGKEPGRDERLPHEVEIPPSIDASVTMLATPSIRAAPQTPAAARDLPRDLIEFLADAYPEVRDARLLWQRAGGRSAEVENFSRPFDLWQRLWLRSVQGASVRPRALLVAVRDDYPTSTLIARYLEAQPLDAI